MGETPRVSIPAPESLQSSASPEPSTPESSPEPMAQLDSEASSKAAENYIQKMVRLRRQRTVETCNKESKIESKMFSLDLADYEASQQSEDETKTKTFSFRATTFSFRAKSMFSLG